MQDKSISYVVFTRMIFQRVLVVLYQFFKVNVANLINSEDKKDKTLSSDKNNFSIENCIILSDRLVCYSLSSILSSRFHFSSFTTFADDVPPGLATRIVCGFIHFFPLSLAEFD